MAQELDLSHFSEEKQALFRLLFEAEEAVKPPEPSLTARPADTELMPLTYSQKRACFIDWSSPDAPANYPLGIQITGALDPTQLAQSFDTLIGRHEILRTQCLTIGETLYQKVLPAWQMPLTVEGLEGMSAAAQADQLSRLATHEAMQPLDLANGRPLRCRLLQLGEQQFVLLLTLHYFAIDGWSVRLLLKELFDDYTARTTGVPMTLPALPIQYADFAITQAQWNKSIGLQREIEFWQKQWPDLPALLDLPTDRPRPAIQTYKGAKSYFTIDEAIAQALVELSRQAEVTLFTTLLAAFKTLLWQITSQDELTVGIITSNRPHLALEQLIGNFSNQIPLCTDLSDNPTFWALLTRLQAVAHAILAHQQIPTEELIAALKIPRDPSRPPLCPVTFVLHHAAMLPEVDGLALTLLPVEVITAPYELSLAFFMTANKLTATLQYNTDLFDLHTIRRWVSALQTILTNVVANPNAQLTALLPATDLPFARLDTLPLLPNGKVERKALPPSGRAQPALERPFVAPRTVTEKQLATLWEELLAHHPIGIQDDFFALGGNSLALLKLATQLKRQFGQEVSLQAFLQRSTIEKLAQLLDASSTEELPPLIQQGHEDFPPLTEADTKRITPFLLGQQCAVQRPTRQPQWHHRLLPFATCMRLLYQMCRIPLVQTRFFPEERQLLHAFLPQIGVKPAQMNDVVAAYLMRRLCTRYYRPALVHSLWHNLQQMVVLSGQNVLAEARQRERGILVLNIHGATSSGRLLAIILKQLGYDDFMLYGGKAQLQNDPALRNAFQQYFSVTQDELVNTKFLSLQMEVAQQKLRAGGIVWIAPDGGSGQRTVTMPVLGRERTFSTGFAELSLETGATAIPTRCVLLPNGTIQVTFLPPLDSGTIDAPHEERVRALMQQYVAFLEETWQLQPGNIEPSFMKRYLANQASNTARDISQGKAHHDQKNLLVVP
ncbi:MAG: condensation domain-containing protein [Caldilineaceae bacterium]